MAQLSEVENILKRKGREGAVSKNEAENMLKTSWLPKTIEILRKPDKMTTQRSTPSPWQAAEPALYSYFSSLSKH
jgi:hypothetical protein